MADKSTGWKIPLLFCAVAVAIVAAGSLFKDEKVKPPEVPAKLEHMAREIRIDMDAPQNRDWKEAIIEAGGGFSDGAVKDERLGKVIRQALDARRMDVACTAINLMRKGEMREKSLFAILETSLSDCQSLPWGVFALHGSGDPVNLEKMHGLLIEKWQQCEKKKD